MSLPVRERGLKHLYRFVFKISRPSLPVRERGLKRSQKDITEENNMSLPVRERGLKPCEEEHNGECYDSRSPCGSVD